MTSTWYAAILATAAATVTYVTCIRPMRRHRRAETGVDEQIAALTRELNTLRAGDRAAAREDHSAGPVQRRTDADTNNQ
ncbi:MULTISPECIES: hypothetical protein [Nocardia]|uniref:hypothetical protein n=1 Tax=Nocardia TaxID=1817 RepID=UPI00030245EE|nr:MULTISPECIES: hypothetical protein [Nocardia]